MLSPVRYEQSGSYMVYANMSNSKLELFYSVDKRFVDKLKSPAAACICKKLGVLGLGGS